MASEAFDFTCVKARELDTQAEIADIDAIQPDSIVLVLSAEEESQFV